MPPSRAPSSNSTPLKNFQLVFFLLLALAFMIQGWGDRVGFFSHPARTGLLAVFAFSVLVLLFVPFDLLVGGGLREIPRQRWATFLAISTVGGLCWYLPYADRRNILVWPENDVLRYLGLTATALGMSIRVAGMVQLGNLFSGFVMVQQEHHLITTGCYRWIRHPIYTGSLLAFAGFLLVFRNQIIVVALPLYFIGTLWRIADEERLFTEAFGEEYKQYKVRTWKLLPFLY